MSYFRSAIDKAIFDWVNAACGNLNCVQYIEFDAVPTAGTWFLSLDGEDTANIAYDAVAADVKSAIEAGFSGITTVTVTGDYTNGFEVTFTSPQYTNQNVMTIDITGLTTTTLAGVEITQVGVDEILWIYDKQETTRPTLPYGTIKIRSIHDDVIPYHEDDESSETRTYYHKGHIDLSLNVYGDSDIFDKMYTVKRSIRLNHIKLQLVADGLFYRSQGDALDLSELVSSKFELRCQNDFRFGFALTFTEEIPYATRVSGTILDVDFDVS